MKTIYFDYNATTPLDPAVRDAMLPFLDGIWGNPSSVHHVGQKARACLDDARDRASRVLGCKPSEIIFTSGGTESVNLAILGAARLMRYKGKHIIASSIEHHAVLHCLDFLVKNEGFEISLLPVSSDGFVSVESLKNTIRSDTVLVSIMAANNEIGTIQPVSELGALCRSLGVLFHTDAVQWFGKESFKNIHQFNADLVSVCAHKFHGPKGTGLLFARSPLLPIPVLYGGGHENERRAGTENLAGILGLVEALERFVPSPAFDPEKIFPLSDLIASSLQQIEGVKVICPHGLRLSNTVAFTVSGTDSASLLAALDLEGICASSGSACSAGSLEASHVLSALGYDLVAASSLIRFSLGRENSREEVVKVSKLLPSIIIN